MNQTNFNINMYLNDTVHLGEYTIEWQGQRMVELYSIWVPVIFFLCATAFFINAFVLCAYSCIERQRWTASLRLSRSLVICDIWNSVLTALNLLTEAYLPMVHKIFVFGDNYCLPLTVEVCRMPGLITGVLHLLAMAVNHYISTAFPFTYQEIMSNRNIYLIIATLWLFPPMCVFMYAWAVPGSGYRSPQCQNTTSFHVPEYRLSISISVWASLLICFGLYGLMIMTLRQMRKKFVAKETVTTTSSYNTDNINGNAAKPLLNQKGKAQSHPSSAIADSQMRRERRMLVTSALICGTMCAGWLPATIGFADTTASCPDGCPWSAKRLTFIRAVMSLAMLMIKSIVNPIIYAFRIPEVHDQITNHLCVACIRAAHSYRSRQRSDTLTESHTLTLTNNRFSGNNKQNNNNANALQSESARTNFADKTEMKQIVVDIRQQQNLVECLHSSDADDSSVSFRDEDVCL